MQTREYEPKTTGQLRGMLIILSGLLRDAQRDIELCPSNPTIWVRTKFNTAINWAQKDIVNIRDCGVIDYHCLDAMAYTLHVALDRCDSQYLWSALNCINEIKGEFAPVTLPEAKTNGGVQ